MTDRQAALDTLKEGIDALLAAGVTADETDQLFRQVVARCPRLVDYREVCDNLYDGIHITDGEGTVLFINQAYTRTTGILPAEILGRKVSDIEAEGKLYKGSVTAKVLEKRMRVNSVATIFAWTGALRKRGELDHLPDLMAFADKLEKATLDTIASGKMTKDLALITSLQDVTVLNSRDFILAIREKLEQ